jgi:polyribonucleotide nucleotidyltransferase
VIAAGGKNVRKIQDDTGSTIEIQDDGTVNIAAADGPSAERAISMIEALTEDVEVGKEYTGTVKRIMDIGAFVEIVPGKEGLVRINQLANHFVEKVEDVVKIGDPLRVKVIGIDPQGRINLSHKVLLPDYVESADGGRGAGRSESFNRGGRGSDGRRFSGESSGSRGDRSERGDRFDRGERSDRGERGGPTSRSRYDGRGHRSGEPPAGYRYVSDRNDDD